MKKMKCTPDEQRNQSLIRIKKSPFSQLRKSRARFKLLHQATKHPEKERNQNQKLRSALNNSDQHTQV
jgi:hypothetical protein